MTISVLRKSTVRPWPSVSRPSSSTCSSTLNTSGMRLLDLVEQHHLIRPPPHRLGERAAFLVADIAGRRADQARDRMLLHVFRHVDADERRLVVEQEFRERLGQLRLADAGRAEEHERADRPVRILQAGARAAHGVRDRLHRFLLADDAPAQAAPPCAAASPSRLRACVSTGTPVQREPPARCGRRSTASSTASRPSLPSRSSTASSFFSSSGNAAIGEFAGALVLARCAAHWRARSAVGRARS